jgi:hypothetical protein
VQNDEVGTADEALKLASVQINSGGNLTRLTPSSPPSGALGLPPAPTRGMLEAPLLPHEVGLPALPPHMACSQPAASGNAPSSPTDRLAQWARGGSRVPSGATPAPTQAPGFPMIDWNPPRDAPALEVAQLCTLFLGKTARRFWLMSVLALHVTAMWVCAAVWVTCASVAIAPKQAQGTTRDELGAVDDGSDRAIQLWCLLAFSVLILPLCMFKPGSQVRVQLALACATLLTVLAMVVTVAVAVVGEEFRNPPPPPMDAKFAFFNMQGFGRGFSTLVFSQIVQQTVPALAHDAREPARTRTTIAAAVITTSAIYLVLGTLSALLFRGATDPVITLNWISYTAGFTRAPVWASVLAHWIVLLPIISTTAAFPLFNATLASNLEEVLPRSVRRRPIAGPLCATVPLLCTALVRDTAMIFALCGLAGFVMVFFMPAALQVTSLRLCLAKWGEQGRHTPSSTRLSREIYGWIVLMIGGVSFGFSLWQVALGIVQTAEDPPSPPTRHRSMPFEVAPY